MSQVIDADHFLPSRLMHTVFGLPSIVRGILSRISPILGISKNSPWKRGPLHVNESYRSMQRLFVLVRDVVSELGCEGILRTAGEKSPYHSEPRGPPYNWTYAWLEEILPAAQLVNDSAIRDADCAHCYSFRRFVIPWFP